MLKEILVLLSVFFTVSVAIARTQCKHDSECGTGECCFYHEGPMVASKKRDVLLPFEHIMAQGGWCEKYRLEGEHCSSIEKMNGHCGCGPGLKCTMIKDPTIAVHIPPIISTIHKRSMLFGYHEECRPIA